MLILLLKLKIAAFLEVIQTTTVTAVIVSVAWSSWKDSGGAITRL